MDQVCLVVPVQAGKSDDARAFKRELEEQRKGNYAQSERRIGIEKEVWFLAGTGSGDLLVSYMESEDFANALRLFSASQDEFDLWFKRRFADSTGVDLNNPPEMMHTLHPIEDSGEIGCRSFSRGVENAALSGAQSARPRATTHPSARLRSDPCARVSSGRFRFRAMLPSRRGSAMCR
jgi:hypothetical protein